MGSGLDRLSEVPGLHSGGGERPRETGQTPGTELKVISSEGRVQDLDGCEARKRNGNMKDTMSIRVKAFFSGCHREEARRVVGTAGTGDAIPDRSTVLLRRKKNVSSRTEVHRFKGPRHLFDKKREREVRMDV